MVLVPKDFSKIDEESSSLMGACNKGNLLVSNSPDVCKNRLKRKPFFQWKILFQLYQNNLYISRERLDKMGCYYLTNKWRSIYTKPYFY